MYFVKNDFIDFLHHTSREISRKFAPTRVNLHLRGATPQILDVTKGFIEDMREGKKCRVCSSVDLHFFLLNTLQMNLSACYSAGGPCELCPYQLKVKLFNTYILLDFPKGNFQRLYNEGLPLNRALSSSYKILNCLNIQKIFDILDNVTSQGVASLCAI